MGREFAGFVADAVDAARPDLDAAIEGAGSALEVDGVIVLIAQELTIVKVVDKLEVPRVAGVDFL